MTHTKQYFIIFMWEDPGPFLFQMEISIDFILNKDYNIHKAKNSNWHYWPWNLINKYIAATFFYSLKFNNELKGIYTGWLNKRWFSVLEGYHPVKIYKKKFDVFPYMKKTLFSFYKPKSIFKTKGAFYGNIFSKSSCFALFL